MVIRILTGKDVAGAVRYNEKKVNEGQAEYVHIANYPDNELAARNARFRLDVLEQYARLNPAIERPSVHLAVAFHPSERLTRQQLAAIGSDILTGVGYEKQPCLMYQHHDTAHPHIHIVTVNVDARGNKIDDSFLRKRLQNLRRHLEQTYSLRPADESAKLVRNGGVGEGGMTSPDTTDTLSHRVQQALERYTFGSIDSFRRFLRGQQILMNTRAGRSRAGITFQWVDETGSASRPVKASALAQAPTYKKLTNRFADQTKQHQNGCKQLNELLHKRLSGYRRITEADFKQSMRQAGVDVLEQANEYLYVHKRAGVVAQERELDSAFSRLSMAQRFGQKTERRSPAREESIGEGSRVGAPAMKTGSGSESAAATRPGQQVFTVKEAVGIEPIEKQTTEPKQPDAEPTVSTVHFSIANQSDLAVDRSLKKKKNNKPRARRRL